jgi:hypothetical protein
MLSDVVDIRATAQRKDDFWDLNTSIWTHIDDGATGTGAVLTAAGGAGGILSVATAAATNDYHGFVGPTVLEAVASRPFRAAIRFKITETAANLAHWCFLVTDTTTTGGYAATTGAPLASYTGFGFYKAAGAAVVLGEVSNATTKTTIANVATFVSGAWTELAIDFDPGDGVTGKVTLLYNGQPTNAKFVPIAKMPFLLASMNPMGLLFSVMASSAVAQTILVDYAGWEQAR